MSIRDDKSWARSASPGAGARVHFAALARPLLRPERRRHCDDDDEAAPEPVSTLSFFLKYLKSPATVGAVAPSGQHLASLITSEIDPATGPVLELGAGDGIFTAALLRRGVSPEDVVAVELDPVFAERLTRRFPEINVVNAPAERALRDVAIGHECFGAAISGLPLLNFPWRTRRQLLRLIFQRLAPGAALYQFTYGLGAPIPKPLLKSIGLEERFLGRVFRNIPPAAVFKITRTDRLS
jgi:phospholipid N-methyltransferase